MRKISVKNPVDFRRKSLRGKQNFVAKLKLPVKPSGSEGGGNYWIPALSGVQHAFRDNDLTDIDEKIKELEDKIAGTKYTISKNMYKANIGLLNNYKPMEHKKFRPGSDIIFQKKSSANPVLTIKGLEIQVQPAHVFSFGKKDAEEVGAVWFVAVKNGYRKEELRLFCDLLYRYLKTNYAKKYGISTKYCVVIDLSSSLRVHFDEIERGKLASLVGVTLDEINKLL